MDELRKRIDAIDAHVVELLNERTKAALEIGKHKSEEGGEVYVPAREKAVLDRVAGLSDGPLGAHAVQSIYREIMSASLALQQTMRVAYLGPASTFTHLAARSRFGASVEYLACDSIMDVFRSVEKESCAYGVVPVENSTEGAVTHTLDQFVDTNLKICSEIMLPVSHNLMASVPKEQIKKIYSHPQVLAQCRQWLQREMPGIELITAGSTARSAEMAKGEEGAGALASELAAELYGLDVLEREVQDLSANTTRFLVIARKCSVSTGDDKTSVLFSVHHESGALHSTLESFKKYGVNMMKIESRPSRAKAWEYYFYVDLDGHTDDENVQRALEDVAEHCAFMKVLGSYPKALVVEDQ